MKEEQKQSRLIASNAHAVKCRCCELPAFVVRNGVAIFRNKHHGKTHEEFITPESLRSIIDEVSRQQPAASDAQ